MNLKKISFVAVMSAAGCVSRVVIPLYNVKPVAFIAIASGMIAGYAEGFAVGLLSMFLSDLFLGVGPWTFIDAPLMGMAGALGSLWKDRNPSRVELGVGGYLITLAYDVLSTLAFCFLFGVPILVGLLMLFLPAGSVPYPFGPAHELTTAILLSTAGPPLKRWGGRIG